MKNVNIMRVHRVLGEGEGGRHKKYIYGELPKKGVLAKDKEEGVFDVGVIDTSMHTMT